MPPAGGVPAPWPRRFTTWFRATRTWRMTLFLDSRVLPHRQIHCALLSPRLEIRNESPKAPKTNAAGRFHRRRGQERPGAMLATAVLEGQGLMAAFAWRLGRHRNQAAPRGPGRGAAGRGGRAPAQRNRSCGARTILSAARSSPPVACPRFRRQARREMPNPKPELRNSCANFSRNFFSPEGAC